jgi:hypothetical protein
MTLFAREAQRLVVELQRRAVMAAIFKDLRNVFWVFKKILKPISRRYSQKA